MNKIQRILLLGAAFCLTTVSGASAASPTLEEGFAAPPAEAKPLTWWHWINGNVTQEGIRADLEDMKRVGIGGAQMLDTSIYLPPGPVRYGSDAWHEHVQFAIRTADELGLELDLMNSPGWSGAGGPWITPDRGMKRYVWTETEIEGGPAIRVSLKRPTAKLDFYRDVAVLAIPSGSAATLKEAPLLKGIAALQLDPHAKPISPDRVLVLTKSMDAAGLLTGELPPGKWTILRFGYTPTGSMNHPAQPEGHGLECDKMDAEIVAFQFEQSLGRILREAGPLVGKSLRGVLFDSFEGGYQNWCESLPADFQRLAGYDLIPWLPVLTGRTIGSLEQSKAFLRDFRSAIQELIAERYFGTMQRLAQSHGLKVYAEAQGGPVNPFLCNEYADVPMNEFWMPDARPRFGHMKAISSIASLLGRPVVAAEAFTAKPEDGRWLATPATMKAVGDCAFAAGINRFIFHTYAHQPFSDVAPGFTLGRYGTHFGRLNTWWPMAGAWMNYLARCQFLLQQGRPVADLLVVVDDEAEYPLSPAPELSIPPGSDFDACNPRHLESLEWKDGAFRSPNGAAYRILLLPKRWTASLLTLKRLKTFLGQGAAIAGSPPMAPTGLLDQRDHLPEWQALVAEVFQQVQPAVSALTPPDVTIAEPEIFWRHRARVEYELGGWESDIYFISNQSGKPVTVQASFRASGRVPEIWDPVTGRHAPAPAFKAETGRVSLPLALDVSGSTFVVFRRILIAPDEHVRAAPVAAPLEPIAIDGPWRLHFQPGRGAPAEIALERLSSWTQQADPGVKYFSGIATYSTSFDLPAVSGDPRWVLNLGRVCDIAEVKVNGRSAGIAWTAPFQLDVTGLVHAGKNELEIAVANRWVNRLIGDDYLPPDACYDFTGSKFTAGRLAELPPWLGNHELTRQRQRFTFATWHFYDKESPLLESGLLGPVRLERR